MSAEGLSETSESNLEHNRTYLKTAVNTFRTGIEARCSSFQTSIEYDLKFGIKGELSPELARDLEKSAKIRSEIRSKLMDLDKLFKSDSSN